MTQSNLDASFLRNLEAWTVERTKANVIEALQAQGKSAAAPSIIGSSVYVTVGSVKLAVIRLTIGDQTTLVAVVGLVGEELRRVGCVRESPVPIPITYGRCGGKIKEVFGVAIGDS